MARLSWSRNPHGVLFLASHAFSLLHEDNTVSMLADVSRKLRLEN
jgi:hypothetical protein